MEIKFVDGKSQFFELPSKKVSIMRVYRQNKNGGKKEIYYLLFEDDDIAETKNLLEFRSIKKLELFINKFLN